MSSNQFRLDLRKFVEKAKGNVDLAVRGTVFKIIKSIDIKSPVGDATAWKSPPPPGYVGGRFRGSWMLGVDSVPTGDPGTIDADGGATITRAMEAMPEKAAGHIFYYVSNLPYSMRIENGWSKQAPSGVVGLTVIEFPQVVEAAVSELPK